MICESNRSGESDGLDICTIRAVGATGGKLVGVSVGGMGVGLAVPVGNGVAEDSTETVGGTVAGTVHPASNDKQTDNAIIQFALCIHRPQEVVNHTFIISSQRNEFNLQHFCVQITRLYRFERPGMNYLIFIDLLPMHYYNTVEIISNVLVINCNIEVINVLVPAQILPLDPGSCTYSLLLILTLIQRFC